MHVTVSNVLHAAGDGHYDTCVLDIEASSEQFLRGTARYADVTLLVVEPYFMSLESARRMSLLGADLGLPRAAVVGNKIRDGRDESTVRDFATRHDLEIAGLIPYDEMMHDAERAGVAPLDHDPGAPSVAAIGELARSLVA
jgi:CO dehydrogenase nickel-insertion accessory protein CooC1